MAIDISDFFTTDGEMNGVWYEPVVNGHGIGIEFKILGNSSDQAIVAAEQFEKDSAVAEKETDVLKKTRLEGKALTKRIASMVIDIRGKDGKEITLKGKPLVYSKENVETILDGSKAIKSDIMKAFLDTSNFMTRKD